MRTALTVMVIVLVVAEVSAQAPTANVIQAQIVAAKVDGNVQVRGRVSASGIYRAVIDRAQQSLDR